MSANPAPAPPQRGFFGHPRGLSTLFFTEMWERFSYYGMKAILAPFLYTAIADGGLGIDKGSALSIVSVYASAVYMGSLPGGWLADRLLGPQRTVLYGGVLIMAGHICMAFPGGATSAYLGLALIVMGTSLLKPNISTIVGGLYSEQDTRRDAGFTVFYMGINIGAFASPIVAGWFSDSNNWHLGFGTAAVGMAIGLVQYLIGRPNLGGAGAQPPNPFTDAERAGVLTRLGIGAVVLVAVIAIALVTGVLTVDGVVNVISVVSIVLPIVYFTVMLRSQKTSAVERDRVKAYIPLFIGATMFWMIYEQAGTVINVYAHERVDRVVFGWEFPAAWFQSVLPAWVIILAPLMALLWVRMGTRQPSTPRKFALALFMIGLSFGILALFSLAGGQASVLLLLGVFAVQTVGELLLSPVGLSATTKLAPAAFRSQMMGLWFLATAAGNGIAAQVVPLYTTLPELAYFGIIGSAAVLVGVLLWFGCARVTRYMHGVA